MNKNSERLILTIYVLFVLMNLYLLLLSYSGAIARSASYDDRPGLVWTSLTVLDSLSLIVFTTITVWVMKTSRGAEIFLAATFLLAALLLIVNYAVFTAP